METALSVLVEIKNHISAFRDTYGEVEELKKTVASLSASLSRMPSDPFGVFKESLEALNSNLRDVKSDLALIAEHEKKFLLFRLVAPTAVLSKIVTHNTRLLQTFDILDKSLARFEQFGPCMMLDDIMARDFWFKHFRKERTVPCKDFTEAATLEFSLEPIVAEILTATLCGSTGNNVSIFRVQNITSKTSFKTLINNANQEYISAFKSFATWLFSTLKEYQLKYTLDEAKYEPKIEMSDSLTCDATDMYKDSLRTLKQLAEAGNLPVAAYMELERNMETVLDENIAKAKKEVLSTKQQIGLEISNIRSKDMELYRTVNDKMSSLRELPFDTIISSLKKEEFTDTLLTLFKKFTSAKPTEPEPMCETQIARLDYLSKQLKNLDDWKQQAKAFRLIAFPHLANEQLVCLLVDMSASMMTSMGGGSTRLQTFQAAVRQTIGAGATVFAQNPVLGESFRVAAFGFGFRSDPVVRNLLPQEYADKPVTLSQFYANYSALAEHMTFLGLHALGATPMKQAVNVVGNQLQKYTEECLLFSPPIIFFLSDGEPTDAKITDIVAAMEELKQKTGAFVVSCYITSDNIIQPRRLFSSALPTWPPAAKLMFECASPLPIFSPMWQLLKEYGWTLDDSTPEKAFTQINHQLVLTEFMSMILAPVAGALMPKIAATINSLH